MAPLVLSPGMLRCHPVRHIRDHTPLTVNRIYCNSLLQVTPRILT